MAMASPNLFLAFGAGCSPSCRPASCRSTRRSSVTSPAFRWTSFPKAAGLSARVLKHSLAFFAGFSVIYIALGLTASALGSFFYSSRSWLPIVGGIFIIVMGLQLLGILRLPFLMRDTRRQLASRPEGYLGSALVGLTFAAGWTPCIGPILGAVLALGRDQPGVRRAAAPGLLGGLCPAVHRHGVRPGVRAQARPVLAAHRAGGGRGHGRDGAAAGHRRPGAHVRLAAGGHRVHGILRGTLAQVLAGDVGG